VLLETVDSALRRAFSDSIRREAGLQDFHASGIKPKAGELEAAVRSVLREGDNKVGGAGGANRAAPGEAPSPALLPRPSRQAALECRVRRTRADCAEVGAGNVPQQRRVALRRAVELVELGPEYFDWEVGSWVYQQLMDALVRAGEFETAVAVWEKCRREKPEVVDVKSWTVYIRALAGLNRCTGRAVAILADVRSDGVIPDKTMLKTLQTVLKSQRDEQGVLLVGEQLDALGE
jgi:pentatricopeptide repeat protein